MMDPKAKEDLEPEVIITDEQPGTGEIDSTSDDAADKQAATEKKKSPERKRGNDRSAKIKELWAKLEDEKRTNEQLANEAAGERARRQKAEQIATASIEDSLTTKQKLLTKELATANEQDDHKKAAEVQAELTRVSGQAAQLDQYKLANQPREQEKQAPAAQEQQEQQLSPTMQRWIDDNADWYSDESDNFDEEKVADVTYYAQQLERDLIQRGQGAKIGTREYRRLIDEYIKENWNSEPDSGEDDVEEEEQPAAKVKPRGFAAPVQNRNQPGQPKVTKNEIRLTAEERDMAIALSLKHKNGQEYTNEEKVKVWAKNRESAKKPGPITVRSLGGQ